MPRLPLSRIKDAESLAALTQYDLAIIDLSLSHSGSTEGFQVLRIIRRRSPAAKMILLTASESSLLERQAFRCGAHAFLRKPWPLSEVARIASELIGGFHDVAD